MCKGEYHIPALQGPAADVSTSTLWNPSLFHTHTHSHTHAHTHTHTHSPLEVLSVKAGYFVSLSTFDCCFHGGLVKRGSFDTKKYNKQRKLETRQTFRVTANIRRHASQEGFVSGERAADGNVYNREFTVGGSQLNPIRLARLFGTHTVKQTNALSKSVCITQRICHSVCETPILFQVK